MLVYNQLTERDQGLELSVIVMFVFFVVEISGVFIAFADKESVDLLSINCRVTVGLNTVEPV